LSPRGSWGICLLALPEGLTFPTDSSFEKRLYEAPVLTQTALHSVEDKYGGSLYTWNGAILHVAVTAWVNLGYTVIRLYGDLCGPTSVIFEALDHTMQYLYFYRHIPLMSPPKPLSHKSLYTLWAHGTAEYDSQEYDIHLISTAHVDHA
jgi:hypothetical protein